MLVIIGSTIYRGLNPTHCTCTRLKPFVKPDNRKSQYAPIYKQKLIDSTVFNLGFAVY